MTKNSLSKSVLLFFILLCFGAFTTSSANLSKDSFLRGETILFENANPQNGYSVFTPAMISSNLVSGCVFGGLDQPTMSLLDACGSAYFKEIGTYSIIEMTNDQTCFEFYLNCKSSSDFLAEYFFTINQVEVSPSFSSPLPSNISSPGVSPTPSPVYSPKVSPAPSPVSPAQVIKKLAPELREKKMMGQLTKQLARGAKDHEIEILQEILAQDPLIYPEGLVTGYFGPMTEKAIQRFQAKFGIVSSGDPDSTGFGRVGPRTLAKLNKVISNEQ